jgi:hypothetical protein
MVGDERSEHSSLRIGKNSGRSSDTESHHAPLRQKMPALDSGERPA